MKKILFILLLLITYIFICAYSYSTDISNELSNSILRLHIIANSNSKKDQEAKYKVKNNILSYLSNLSSYCSSKEETIQLINEHKETIEELANQTLLKEGLCYTSTVEFNRRNFETKNTSIQKLPTGNYDTIDIKLGNASGQNWWSILYPTFCYTDENSTTIDNTLSTEEYNLITNYNNPTINFKFKFIEFFNSIDFSLSD